MILGQVIAVVVSTVKHKSLSGAKLLLVQPLMADRATADGNPVVAVDATGAGTGQRVMLTSDGQAARQLLRSPATPVRWTIIGTEDHS